MRLFFWSKIKGRASKVFCQGYQAIVCSVEKTLLTLKLRLNIGRPWGVELGSKIQRGAEIESCKARKSSRTIWCNFLGIETQKKTYRMQKEFEATFAQMLLD